MGLTSVALFVALTIIVATNASNFLTPRDKEVIYNWRARVKAGTHLPARYASQCHVQEHDPHEVPLPPEVDDLNRVFKIIYNLDGLVEGIVTQAGEKGFSRYIKKAIATILQLNNSVVGKIYQRPEVFISKEESIYGHGFVDYRIVPYDDGVEVYKDHDMLDSSPLHRYRVANTECSHCDVKFEEMLMHNINKKYIIVKKEDHHVVKTVVTTGGILYYPYQAQSDAHFIGVNQTFQLDDIVPVKEQFHIDKEYLEASLSYVPFEESPDGIDVDSTNGRRVIDYEKLFPMVQDMLKDIPQYLKENHIHTQEPDSKRGQLINRVQSLLLGFTIEKLSELRQSLSGDALGVFYHILPFVGTSASTRYIQLLITSRSVSDDNAIQLLQQMTENLAPSLQLLTQLEDLIHLNETYSWKVRKVALLTFGTLIHKSYIYSKKGYFKSDKHGDQQVYEKYVNEYVSHMKSSQEYKVKMVYILGLHNMKLSIGAKHLVPALNGELWQDEHLRFLSLWAAGVSYVYNSDTNAVFETLWPVFTNRNENTEMRILSYYYLMQIQPSHSRLQNLLVFMLHETNEEVNHFHYTFMKSVIQSTNPCRQEMRTKLAQLMKFTSPPAHGLSSVKFTSYQDIKFGFAEEVETYFINTNRSRFHCMVFNSLNFGKLQEEYLLYLKAHNGRPDGPDSILETLTDLLSSSNITKKFTSNEEHVEGAILKRGQVLNVYYLDIDIIEDIYEIMKPMEQNSILTANSLYVGYQWYQRALLPTDLGTPAVWEFLMPAVHQNHFTVSHGAPNNYHIENTYVNWIHYRHGLAVYNPISDVWQGVNRIHSYNTIIPIHFDLTKNPHSWLLSSKKHKNSLMNVAAFRSHVKQIVFVEDIYNQNVLEKSCPKSKRYQLVSQGPQYRNNYTLLDVDDLNTGHRWYVEAYDTDKYASKGSFLNHLYLYAEPHKKHFNSPTEYLILVLNNVHRYMLLLPRTGQYGFVVKAEQTQNIELSYRFKSDPVKNNDFLSEIKQISRLNFAVTNDKEQKLRAWDVSTAVNLNRGHTIANFKAHVIRTVLGQKDLNICVEGVKKWNLKQVTGHLDVAVSHTDDGKCFTNDTVIDVTMIGERSLEQQNGYHKYGSCQYIIPYPISHYHTTQCVISRSTVRHYTYDVKTSNVPSEFKKTIAQWWDHLRSYYYSYYLQDEHNENIEDNNLKIDVLFPVQGRKMDIQIKTSRKVHELGILTDYWKWLGMGPDSLVFSQDFILRHRKGLVNHCLVCHDHYSFNQKFVSENAPEKWTPYVKNEDYRNTVYIKHAANNTIAMKIVDRDHTLELFPQGDSYKIVLDGQESPLEEYYNQDWIYYQVFNQDVDKEMAIIIKKSGIHLKYNIHRVTIVTFKTANFKGHCFNQDLLL